MRLARWVLIAVACLLLGMGCRAPHTDNLSTAAESVSVVPQSPTSEPPEDPIDTPVLTLDAPTGAVDRSGAIPAMPARRTGNPSPSSTPYSAPALGEVRTFRVANFSDATYRLVDATLEQSSAQVEMWVEQGVTLDSGALLASMREIEERILPALEAIYGEQGSEATPLCAVLNVRTSGASGYYAAADASEGGEAAPPLFVMNISAVAPGTDQYAAVLAHEMQHVWLAQVDPNEAAWVSEGASQLLETLAGYPVPSQAIAAFAAAPEIQLNTWSAERGDVYRHYGASFLLLQYYYERCGLGALRLLLAAPEDGIAAFDRVLGALDGGSFRALFADWTVANLLDSPDLAGGAHGYRDIDVSVSVGQRIGEYPAQRVLAGRPYAAQYVELERGAAGDLADLSVQLDAPATTRLVAATVPDGPTMWWSNRGDAGHAWLERAIDLRAVTAATLTFDLWHDIEAGWDWGGVRVSSDDGASWTWLSGRHTVQSFAEEQEPQPQYTGRSGPNRDEAQWVAEEIDLSPYAGTQILLRFDMFTDDAQTEPGLCLDNITIDAIGWRDEDSEATGWTARGFVRTDAVVPLDYVVRAVLFSGDSVSIQDIAMPDGHAEWASGDDGQALERAILVISPITDASGPLTTQEIPITLTLRQVP